MIEAIGPAGPLEVALFALLLPAVLTACWQFPEDVEFDEVAFQSDVTNITTGVVRSFTYPLACPDGSDARFYIVYDTAATSLSPVALVTHSSAFDYVINPNFDNPIAGTHYAGSSQTGVTRLEQAWGVQKVWETLGMHDAIDSAEVNLGTLPTALLEQGFVAIYPINCWGDLWYNEAGTFNNDTSVEYFDRNGGAMAWRMLVMTQSEVLAEDLGVSWDEIPIDPNRIYLVGLGDGARGSIHLMRRLTNDDEGRTVPYAAIKGILLDSPVDDLEGWGASGSGVEEGLVRVFYDPTVTEDPLLRQLSLRRVINEDPKDNTGYGIRKTPIAIVYSNADPKVPADNLDALINVMTEKDGGASSKYCIYNTKQPKHVFTNSDIVLARDFVDYLLTGEQSAKCQLTRP